SSTPLALPIIKLSLIKLMTGLHISTASLRNRSGAGVQLHLPPGSNRGRALLASAKRRPAQSASTPPASPLSATRTRSYCRRSPPAPDQSLPPPDRPPLWRSPCG